MTATNGLHVIWGTGAVGMAVMEALWGQGLRVRMVNRSGKADVLAEVEVVRADANDAVSARQASEGAAVVYNCTNPPYNLWATLLPPLFMGIAESAAHVGAKHVVGDNLYMYGQVSGPMREDRPYAAHTRKGKVRAEVATRLMEMHKAGKVQIAIGRASDYYGPRGTDQAIFGSRVIYPLLAGKAASVIVKLDVPHTYSYIKDFGKGLAALGTHEEAFGEVWHTPNAPATTQRQMLTLFFEEAGLPPKITTVPNGVIRLLGLVNPILREVGEMLYEFDAPFVVDSSKFEQAFGSIGTPPRDAVRETLAWFRAHPQTKTTHVSVS